MGDRAWPVPALVVLFRVPHSALRIRDGGTMSTTFMQSPQLFFTSESVTEGHPDKLCDQVSDAILDAFLTHDPRARVAVETATTTGLIVVLGEVTYEKGYIPIEEIVRKTVKEIGYT